MRIRDGSKQVGRERGNPAFARQVVPDKGDLADFAIFFHEITLAHVLGTSFDQSDRLSCAEVGK
jgi:hypothetical protein